MASFGLVHGLVLIGAVPALADWPLAAMLPAWSPGLSALIGLGTAAGLVGF